MHLSNRKCLPARAWLVAIIVVSVLVRIWVALAMGDQAQPISGAFDQVSYDTLGLRLSQGYGFSFPIRWYPFTPAGHPTSHWSYLYTAYLAIIDLATGHHPLVARLVQVLISALHPWLAYRIGRRLFGEVTGLVAAAMTACYAYFVFFNAALMTQTFYILAVLAAFDLAFEIKEHPTTGKWVLLGLVLGLGTLLRQTLLLFSPLLLGWLIWPSRGRLTWSSLRVALIPITFMALLITPWTLYNFVTYHDFLLLNSNGGYFLWASNHPSRGTQFDENYAPPIPADLRTLSEPALDRALYRQGLAFIVSDPERFVRLSLDRIKCYFRLLPSDKSSDVSNQARMLSFTLYLPFMLLGLALSWGSRKTYLPFFLYLAFDTALHLSTWAAPRYRLPSDAILIVWAALAAVQIFQRLRAVSMRVLARAAGSVAHS